MSNWEKCQERFPNRTSLTEPEKSHLSILFDNYFVATDQGQRFLFAQFTNYILWSAGPTHPWRYLDDNDEVLEEVLSAHYPDKEYIDNLHILKGTGQYQGKDVKYSKEQQCWVYLNNRTVHIHGTSTSESPGDDDTARIEELLERTETIVTAAIQKLQTTSWPASPATQKRLIHSRTQSATQASLLPTPPVSKGKAPAPIPPRTRTPVFRPIASTS